VTLELALLNLGIYSVQVAALIAVASLLIWASRLESPRALLAFRQTLLAACLLLPALQTWRVPSQSGGVRVTQSQAIPVASTAQAALHIPWLKVAAAVLLAGIALRLLWLLSGIIRLAICRRRASLMETPYPQASIYLSEEVIGPVTFGWLRPAVILPATYPALPEATRQAILHHELAHVDRNDWLFTLGEELVRAVLWFHPAIWWLLAQIHLAREQAVDQAVIEQTESTNHYVEALLAMAGVATEQNISAAPLFLKRRQLARRVALLVKPTAMSTARIRVTLVALATLLIPAARFGLMLVPLQAPAQEGKPVASMYWNAGKFTYPPEAIASGTEGNVYLEISIDETGVVRNTKVISGPEQLISGSVQQVKMWRVTLKEPKASTYAASFHYKLPHSVSADIRQIGPAAPITSIDFGAVPAAIQEKVRAEIGVAEGDKISAAHLPAIKEAVNKVDKSLNVNMNSTQDGKQLTIASQPEPESKVIEVGGNAQSAALIYKPSPRYPREAKLAHVQGQVRLIVTIEKDGVVKDIELQSGHPMLVQSAMDAVRQWVYRPTLLNGEPVAVRTTVDVNYTLTE